MQETARQYTRRILGNVEGKKPMEVLAATPRQIARLVAGVPRKRLSRRPAPRTWAVAEILAHLADAELVIGYRIRLVLGASGTSIQAYDQDVWAKFSNYRKHDPAVSLEAFRATRERNVRLLRSLPRKSWDFYERQRAWKGNRPADGRDAGGARHQPPRADQGESREALTAGRRSITTSPPTWFETKISARPSPSTSPTATR